MTTTTEFPTYAELQADIEDEMDLAVSTASFIDQDEMIHYCNKGIDQAEQIIHTIYEDYFLARDEIPLVNGTETYDPPADIYAHKIRGMTYYSGTKVSPIKRLRDWKKFQEYRFDKQYGNNTDACYWWFLLNETPGDWKILFTPTPGTGTVEVWYLRQANRIVNTSDVLDIPEGKNYVLAYMRYRVILKEKRGSPEANEIAAAKEALAEEKQELVDTLTAMIPDAENEIEPDFSHYRDHT